MSAFRDWLCYVAVRRWPFGFGEWQFGEPISAQALRYRIFLVLVPYAWDWESRNDQNSEERGDRHDRSTKN